MHSRETCPAFLERRKVEQRMWTKPTCLAWIQSGKSVVDHGLSPHLSPFQIPSGPASCECLRSFHRHKPFWGSLSAQSPENWIPGLLWMERRKAADSSPDCRCHSWCPCPRPTSWWHRAAVLRWRGFRRVLLLSGVRSGSVSSVLSRVTRLWCGQLSSSSLPASGILGFTANEKQSLEWAWPPLPPRATWTTDFKVLC